MNPDKGNQARFSAVGHHRKIDAIAAILQRLSQELEVADETQRLDIIDRYLIKFPRYADSIREAVVPGLVEVGDVIDAENTVVTSAPKFTESEPETAQQQAPKKSPVEDHTRTKASIGKLQNVPRVDLPVGAPRFLGEYRVIKELGRGGMGVVYLGIDDTISRYVAIKVLPAEYGHQEEFLERFRREQDAVSRLQHPGIIAVYATGEQDGIHYFVMQFVRGISLTEWFKRYWRQNGIKNEESPDTLHQTNGEMELLQTGTEHHSATAEMTDLLGIGDFLHIAERTAQALHFAHQNGILHRDVKPGNIVIDEEGNPILLDFGLAKQETEKTITKSGNILGTVPYMSPEQVTARKSEIDHRADLYALGVILYEGLTGSRPFSSDKIENLMVKIISKEPKPPSEFNPEIGLNINTVILKCLEKRPHNRFANCEALADELGRIRAHRSILSEPIGRLGRLMRWASSNRMQAAFGALAVASLLFLVAFLVQGEMAERQHARESAQIQADKARSSLSAANDTLQRENALQAKQEKATSTTATFESAMVLQDAKRQLDGLRKERFNLCQSSVARFDESFKLNADDSLKKERISALRSWLQAAEDLGEKDTCVLIVERLQSEGVDGDLNSKGFLSLVTSPAGAKVTARQWLPTGDGRLRLSEEALDLGVSPILKSPLAIGSWSLEIQHNDCSDITYPVYIERIEHWGDSSWHANKFADKDWSVDLPKRQDFDSEKWAFIPGGPFQQTYPAFYKELDCQTRWAWESSFFMARRETTFGEYLPVFETILTMNSRMPIDVRKDCTPYYFDDGKPKPRTEIGDDFGIEITELYGRSENQFMASALCGIKGRAAFYFAGVASIAPAPVMNLPSGSQWEKAARGVDGRIFPWGSGFDWSFTAGRRSQEIPLGPGSITLPPGSYPIDTSPYGCVDMSGNASEWCLDMTPAGPQLFISGGMLMNTMSSYFSAWPREPVNLDHFRDHTGIRLARNLE